MVKRVKTMKSDFLQFDLAGKGYLNQKEYQSFCKSILVRPTIDQEIIYFSDLQNNVEDCTNKNMDEIFDFFANADRKITYESLGAACRELNCTNINIKQMIDYFTNGNEYLEYSDFVKIFN